MVINVLLVFPSQGEIQMTGIWHWGARFFIDDGPSLPGDDTGLDAEKHPRFCHECQVVQFCAHERARFAPLKKIPFKILFFLHLFLIKLVFVRVEFLINR